MKAPASGGTAFDRAKAARKRARAAPVTHFIAGSRQNDCTRCAKKYPPFFVAAFDLTCGATVPLLGFGHLLAKGVQTAIAEEGAIGILTGGLTAAAAGVTTSLVCGVVCALLGKSHDQN